MTIRTPVLLIVFNRPEKTRSSLEAIAKAEPETLLVAADGPRNENESGLCAQTREIVDSMDWDCTVLKNYADRNMGCGVRIYTAIDWAFSMYDELIILEDDCIPGIDFFRFCSELLDNYRDKDKVMHISGNNFQGGQSRTRYSYYFSKYTHAWGWATWKRAWQHFEWDMRSWPAFRDQGKIRQMCSNKTERDYWTRIFDQMLEGADDVWDYKWNFSVWKQAGLVIVPDVNLVSNIGFGEGATHTKQENAFSNLPIQSLDTIVHPENIERNIEADEFTYDHNFGGLEAKRNRFLKHRIRRFLGRLWRARHCVRM